MERFHFNIENGETYSDEEGARLTDVDEARRKALRVLSELLREKPDDFWASDCFRVTVTDDSGLSLFTVTVSSTDAPSLQRPH